MDDIRLFNRVLDSAEIVTYTTSTLGLDDREQPQTISVLPNPTQSTLTLALPGFAPAVASVKVLDLTGRVIISQMLDRSLSLSVAHLQPGVYILSATLDGEVYNARFLKQ